MLSGFLEIDMRAKEITTDNQAFEGFCKNIVQIVWKQTVDI